MNNESLKRIADVNLNRAAEGLRVLEDIARFTLNDSDLSASLKEWRQQISVLPEQLSKELLWQRNSGEDSGQNHTPIPQAADRNLTSLIIANSRRVQEALRVLEEVAKEPLMGLKNDLYKNVRFAIYEVQKELISCLDRHNYAKYMRGLYIILDTSILEADQLAKIAKMAIKGGCRLFQLRDKELPKNQLLALAIELVQICRQNDALLIINDYADIAILSNAHGLHVGQSDLPAIEARKILPPDSVIGVSVDTVEQALEAQKAGADYLAVGAIFSTNTKEINVLGMDRLKEIAVSTTLPVWGIGGIKCGNIANVIEAGACGGCVITAVLLAAKPQEAVEDLLTNCNEQHI